MVLCLYVVFERENISIMSLSLVITREPPILSPENHTNTQTLEQQVRDSKTSQKSSRKSLKLRKCLKHLLLGEARTSREEDKGEHVKDTLIYEVKLQTLRHCRTNKTLSSTTTTETAKKIKRNSLILESLHPLFVASRSTKQCFVVFSEESFMELTLSKYQLSSDMRLRVYAIGRNSPYRSIGELESIDDWEVLAPEGYMALILMVFVCFVFFRAMC